MKQEGRLEELVERYKALLESTAMDETSAEKLDAQIVEMISHRNAAIFHHDNQRGSARTTGLGLVGFGGTMLTLLVGLLTWSAGGTTQPILSQVSGIIMAFVATLAVSSIALGFLVLRLYHRQNRFAYPFNEPDMDGLGNSWRWFYYACIDRDTPEGPELSDSDKRKYEVKYLDDLHRYAKRTFALARDPLERLKQDVQQLFVLLEVEFHLCRFQLQLERLLVRGIFSALVVSILAAILAAVYPCLDP